MICKFRAVQIIYRLELGRFFCSSSFRTSSWWDKVSFWASSLCGTCPLRVAGCLQWPLPGPSKSLCWPFPRGNPWPARNHRASVEQLGNWIPMVEWVYFHIYIYYMVLYHHVCTYYIYIILTKLYWICIEKKHVLIRFELPGLGDRWQGHDNAIALGRGPLRGTGDGSGLATPSRRAVRQHRTGGTWQLLPLSQGTQCTGAVGVGGWIGWS